MFQGLLTVPYTALGAGKLSDLLLGLDKNVATKNIGQIS